MRGKRWLLLTRWYNLSAPKRLQLNEAFALNRRLLKACYLKVPFGVVEAINGNLRALIRRDRGYRDHEYLILKAQKSTAQARLARAA
jgi:transposase